MKSVVELDIDVPREKLAALSADPANITKWMDDLERYEPLTGEPGMPGSTYRMVPKEAIGFFAGGAIRKAHRKHMDAFKRFAEQHG